uniref:Integrase catalytic domain-containing protein n=1 Tax=Myotis myotis TaxID=51298 RepID=A0A7J7Z5T5_MYOMY|nr:hypothetical protein mMyoMyo1_010465 [Myotis myotis]
MPYWQADVTHVPSFGRLKYVHVIIDTCSGAMYAQAHTGEKTRHAIATLKGAFLTLGFPWEIKTDNGPCYTSKAFQLFLTKHNIKHVTGIPYNPQGQAIVERQNKELKTQIQKEKEGGNTGTPQQLLQQALLTLNYFHFAPDGLPPIFKHWGGLRDIPTLLPLIWWRDPLTGAWKGPNPLLTQGRGFACVFPEGEKNPTWIPARSIKPCTTSDEP